MYKDKDKQREANRKASKKRRQLAKREREGMTVTLENVIPQSNTCVIPNINAGEISENSSMNDEPFPKTTRLPTHNDDAYNYSRNPVTLVKSNRGKDIKPQSYNPMMVGYVPPTE